METSYGWIKLHRKLRDNPYMRKPAYRAIWIELLLEAEHGMTKDKKNNKWRKKEEKELKNILWQGRRIYLKPGQLTCGLKQLSEWTGVPRGSCKRVLDCFKSETMIETQTSNKFSLITVLNWEVYQIIETQNETTTERQRNANETPAETPQECKNDNNGKNVNTPLPPKGGGEQLMQKEDFKTFWEKYPRKVNRSNAEGKFLKLKKSLLPVILSALDVQVASAAWQKDSGQFVPHPSTWINGRRWEDEVAPADDGMKFTLKGQEVPKHVYLQYCRDNQIYSKYLTPSS